MQRGPIDEDLQLIRSDLPFGSSLSPKDWPLLEFEAQARKPCFRSEALVSFAPSHFHA